jgi:hypothetical protein
MRIINNYNLNNLKEVKLSKLGNVKIGDLLNAKIVEVSDNKVIADIKGKLVLLNNLLELDLVEGQSLELEVASQKDGKVYARPTNLSFKEELNIEMLSHELKNLGLETSDKNIKVLNFFKENNILFNKTELKEVLDNIKFIEKLVDQMEKGNVDLKSLDINNNLREELVKIITSSFSKKTPETQSLLTEDYLPKEAVEILKVLLQVQGDLNDTSRQVSEKESGQENIERLASEEVALSITKTDETTLEQVKGALTSELKGLELDAILFLVKEKFDVNLSNLILSDNFFSEGKTIGESLDRVVEAFTNMPSIDIDTFEDVFKDIMSLKTLDTEQVDKVIERLFNKSQEEMTLKEKASFKTIKEELTFIKKTNDFNLELNQKVNYFQFNLQNNKRFADVEFFVNKESQQSKKNKKNFKIFVSLQTNHMERVKAIVELKKKDLNITFVTNALEYEKKLKNRMDELRKVIDGIGFNQININFTQKNDHSYKKEFLLDMVASKIDMKV